MTKLCIALHYPTDVNIGINIDVKALFVSQIATDPGSDRARVSCR